MKLTRCLEDSLTQIATIRATFETLAMFPPDDPIRTEIRSTLVQTRDDLTAGLNRLYTQLCEHPDAFEIDFERYRTAALHMMTHGYPRRDLNRLLDVKAFDEGEGALFYFEIAGLLDLDTAHAMLASELMALFVNEVCQAALQETCYEEAGAFDRRVHYPFLVLLFLAYIAETPPLGPDFLVPELP